MKLKILRTCFPISTKIHSIIDLFNEETSKEFDISGKPKENTNLLYLNKKIVSLLYFLILKDQP